MRNDRIANLRFAQNYPARPIRFIVGVASAGLLLAITRELNDALNAAEFKERTVFRPGH